MIAYSNSGSGSSYGGMGGGSYSASSSRPSWNSSAAYVRSQGPCCHRGCETCPNR